VNIWWDQDILPGQNWKHEIQKAMKNSLAVIICLSENLEKRASSGVYPEISNAIEAYQKLPPGSIFLIPVKLSECYIPSIQIDSNRALDDIQHVDLYPTEARKKGMEKLIKSINQVQDKFQQTIHGQDLPCPKSGAVSEELKKKMVRVTLDVPYSSFGRREENTLIGGLANLLDIPIDHILVRQVNEGSVIVTLELPEESARKLLSIWKEPQSLSFLEEFKVKRIQDCNIQAKTVEAKLSLHEIGMDGEWSLGNLSEFSRIYSQVYHLLFSLEVNQTDQKTESKIYQAYQSYPWKGGFSRVNFYKKIESLIPSDYRPKINSISYASPGAMNLRLVKSVAQNIEVSLYAMYHRDAFVHELYKDIYKQMRVMKLTTLQVRSSREEGEKQVLEILTQKEWNFIDYALFYFSDAMEFGDVDILCELTGNRLASLKIILSLYRRIGRLVDLARQDLIDFKT
jgi:hypothetical protein